jgi:hypothetical protein
VTRFTIAAADGEHPRIFWHMFELYNESKSTADRSLSDQLQPMPQTAVVLGDRFEATAVP